jgi:gas vesicle protein GvpL/GvpF
VAERCYVYAIVARKALLPPGITGFHDRPLLLIGCKDLGAVSSEMTSSEPRPVIEDATLHESIVEAIRALVPALPVQFGTVLPDAASVERALERQYDALVSDLVRLGDALEFGLTILWDDDGPSTSIRGGSKDPARPEGARGRGTAYLRARIEETRQENGRRARAQALVDALDAVLSPCSIDQRHTLLPTGRIAARAAYLVQQGSEEAFKAAFRQARLMRPDLRLLLTGPWPPYSFVSRDSGREAFAALTAPPEAAPNSLARDTPALPSGER